MGRLIAADRVTPSPSSALFSSYNVGRLGQPVTGRGGGASSRREAAPTNGNVHPVGTQAVAAALDAQSWLQQAQAAVKLPETRDAMRSRPSVLVAAVAAI